MLLFIEHYDLSNIGIFQLCTNNIFWLITKIVWGKTVLKYTVGLAGLKCLDTTT